MQKYSHLYTIWAELYHPPPQKKIKNWEKDTLCTLMHHEYSQWIIATGHDYKLLMTVLTAIYECIHLQFNCIIAKVPNLKLLM